MRILTPEQAVSRLTSDKNVARTLYTDRKDRTWEATTPLSLEVKTLVAAYVASGMSCRDVGKLFGLNKGYVSQIGNGKRTLSRSGNIVPDEELRKVQKTVGESVAEKATNLVMAALEQVSNARLTDPKNKLRDVTGAAKDLASIVEKVSPKEVGGNIAAVVLMGTAPFSSDRYKVLETSAVVLK